MMNTIGQRLPDCLAVSTGRPSIQTWTEFNKGELRAKDQTQTGNSYLRSSVVWSTMTNEKWSSLTMTPPKCFYSLSMADQKTFIQTIFAHVYFRTHWEQTLSCCVTFENTQMGQFKGDDSSEGSPGKTTLTGKETVGWQREVEGSRVADESRMETVNRVTRRRQKKKGWRERQETGQSRNRDRSGLKWEGEMETMCRHKTCVNL